MLDHGFAICHQIKRNFHNSAVNPYSGSQQTLYVGFDFSGTIFCLAVWQSGVRAAFYKPGDCVYHGNILGQHSRNRGRDKMFDGVCLPDRQTAKRCCNRNTCSGALVALKHLGRGLRNMHAR